MILTHPLQSFFTNWKIITTRRLHRRPVPTFNRRLSFPIPPVPRHVSKRRSNLTRPFSSWMHVRYCNCPRGLHVGPSVFFSAGVDPTGVRVRSGWLHPSDLEMTSLETVINYVRYYLIAILAQKRNPFSRLLRGEWVRRLSARIAHTVSVCCSVLFVSSSLIRNFP